MLKQINGGRIFFGEYLAGGKIRLRIRLLSYGIFVAYSVRNDFCLYNHKRERPLHETRPL